jgi:hypothetical protein
MNTHSLRRLFCAAFILIASAPLGEAGFSEPPIVYFGKITNHVGRRSRPVQGGKMTWTITPSAGKPFVIQTVLAPLPGGYSYRLEVPVEKLVRTAEAPVGVIAATSRESKFRVQIVVNDEEARVEHGGGELNFSEDQRGKLARVDVRISGAFEDTDGDGLPDWWEDEFAALGFDKFNPNDAAGDRNGNGISNLQEYLDGTDPGRTSITYTEWAAAHGLTGPQAAEDADFDFDGELNIVEFGVDSDPRVADRALVEQRVAATSTTNGKDTSLQMTVQVPAIRREGIRYIIETSENLQKWKSLLDTAQASETLMASQPVRLGRGVRAARFIRLRLASANTPGLLADAGVWGISEQAVPRMRRTSEGSALLAAPFEQAVRGQGEAAVFGLESVTDTGSAWAPGQWTATPHVLTFTSGLARGRAFLITAQNDQTLTLDTAGLDLTTVLAANERFDIRAASTLANLFGNPPRALRAGADDDADLIQLGNGTGLDDFAHDGNAWLQAGQTDDRGETVIYPGEGFFVRNRGPRVARLRFTGLLASDQRAITLPGDETLAGSGSPLPVSLAATGLATTPGWTSADFVELWTGKTFKRYFHDGTHWRTGVSRAAQDKVKIAGGTAVRIQRDAGTAPLQWLQSNP